MNPKAAVIIPAAGFGSRMHLDYPKQYHVLAGVPVLVRTIRAFKAEAYIEQLVVVVSADFLEESRTLLATYGLADSDLTLVVGGRRRQDSVRAGLYALRADVEIVLVHDGARPFVDHSTIHRCYAAAITDGAAIAAIPVKDTLKRAAGTLIAATIDRTDLWQAQTPQAVQRRLLEEAFEKNGEADVTDEASLLERAGIPVTLVGGAETNMKITRRADLEMAEKMLSEPCRPAMRIGHGYDAHRFAEGRALVLGGVTIPYNQGLLGHSDADVLTHALCDAVLGAMGEGDIGRHFPDSDARYAGIYSISLLEQVIELASARGYKLANVDITIVCQAPRLAPFLSEMRTILAKACRVVAEVINIKATTTEGLGFTGRKEGIGCHAVVLLYS